MGWDEQRLAPVWHDFGATPHLLVYGDGETGKTNALRLAIRAITTRYRPEEARILLADPGRGLLKDVPEEYRVGYVVDSDALGKLADSAAVSVAKRQPGTDVSPEQLEKRDWWTGPLLFVLVDDYDLFSGAPGTPSPMLPLVPLLAQGAHIGLHMIVARSTSGAMRSVMDPLIRRMWELGNPALLFSYPKEEGKFIGEAKPRTLPAGRAQLVTRRTVQLVQTGLVSAAPSPQEHDDHRRTPARPDRRGLPPHRGGTGRPRRPRRPRHHPRLRPAAGAVAPHRRGTRHPGHPWTLQRLGEDPLDPEATPESAGLRDGDVLHLRPAEAALPALHFDDVSDGVAHTVGSGPGRWRPTSPANSASPWPAWRWPRSPSRCSARAPARSPPRPPE